MTPPRTLDEARTLFPACAFFISTGPDLPVSLDVVDETEATHSFQAATEAEVWTMAFPVPLPDEAEPLDRPVMPPTDQMRAELEAATGAPAVQAIGLFD